MNKTLYLILQRGSKRTILLEVNHYDYTPIYESLEEPLIVSNELLEIMATQGLVLI